MRQHADCQTTASPKTHAGSPLSERIFHRLDGISIASLPAFPPLAPSRSDNDSAFNSFRPIRTSRRRDANLIDSGGVSAILRRA